MVIARNGPKLKEAAKPGLGVVATIPRGGGYQMIGAAPISSLASALQVRLNDFVVDKTGLSGTYDLTVEFADDAPAVADAPPLPTLSTALEQDLGLKLEKGKAEFDVLVVEHIEKVPTEN